MASKSNGNKPLEKKNPIISVDEMYCLRCGKKYNLSEFIGSDSELHEAICKIPYCKDCVEEMYQNYLKKYKRQKVENPEKMAIERMCMILDLYYSDEAFNSALKEKNKKIGYSLIKYYIKHIKLYKYRNRTYDNTIKEKYKDGFSNVDLYSDEDIEKYNKKPENIKAAIKLFGSGFSDDDYRFLYNQYSDWTTRHECQTKAQEEVFKQICFTQLELLKANRKGEDTKDLTSTFQKLLDTAKLQPKQNSGDTVSRSQTFGTLIDKWENTRPLPDIDEDLKDVDKIGKYINIFFKGHLSKMMGIKNSYCKAYDDFIQKYSVKKPEYESDDGDSEVLFDAIFGGDLDDDR